MPVIPLPLFCLSSVVSYVSSLTSYYHRYICYIDSIEQITERLPAETNSLLLLDFSTATRHSRELEELSLSHPKCQSVILNAPQQLKTSQLLKLGKIKGLFYRGTPATELTPKLEHILAGGLCLPVEVTAQLLDYYQSVMIRHGKPHQHNLTQREIDVLRLLRSGFSNTRLADELFVSEHTIKSHLYKIFRKLNIKNRSQAIEWAYKFLP